MEDEQKEEEEDVRAGKETQTEEERVPGPYSTRTKCRWAPPRSRHSSNRRSAQ